MKKENKEFEVTITEDDHRQMVDEGADAEYALKPGRYRAVRGHIQKHEIEAAVATAEGKSRITIYLDNNIIEYFKTLAEAPGSAGYQTLINDTLRRVAEGSAATPVGAELVDFVTKLFSSDQFINALADRVRIRIQK